MTRRLITLASVASLLLGLTAAALWARSYWPSRVLLYRSGMTKIGNHFVFPTNTSYIYAFFIWRGAVGASLYYWNTPTEPETSRSLYEWTFRQASSNSAPYPYNGFVKYLHTHTVVTHRQSVVAMDDIPPHTTDGYVFVLGLWIPALFFTLLPLPWFRHLHQTRRRVLKGLCPHCGYDLRTTPTRCPECGTEPITPSAAKPEQMP